MTRPNKKLGGAILHVSTKLYKKQILRQKSGEYNHKAGGSSGFSHVHSKPAKARRVGLLAG